MKEEALWFSWTTSSVSGHFILKVVNVKKGLEKSNEIRDLYLIFPYKLQY